MAGAEDPSTELLPPTPERAAEAPPAPAPPPLIGRTLGRFTIVERLGKGGSGEVFLAEQAPLGRSAVIKILRREIASVANRVERFLREARLASRLDHPYAAHVYAFGAEPDGVLWIAMEHVKGITLDALVAKRGAMPPSVFGPLFARLCEVAHSAHELGIVHRDIKGANVMVIERAGQLLPKLLDFGIAKADLGGPELAGTAPGEPADGPSALDPRDRAPISISVPGEADVLVGRADLTGDGVTLGSPHYMSPEQWERPSEVDARADIYALGVLAYRCLAGHLPFHDLDRLQLADAHVRSAPPPLPDGVPPALAEVVFRALAKRPDDRWPSALAFGDAIRRAAGTEALETVPIFDPATRDTWLRAGPQPIADAIAHLSAARTTVEADAAVRELVAITCRWLAVLALANLAPVPPGGADAAVREHARAVVGRDDGAPWLRLARAAAAASTRQLPGLVAALGGADPLAQLADQLDDRDRARGPTRAAALAGDVAAAADALRPLEPLLAYQLVHGRAGGVVESWRGPRRRDREQVVVWGEPLAEGEVALLDASGRIVARLSPLAQVIAPSPSAEPELFLLWRSGRGPARLVAAPWGFERDDEAAGLRLAALSTEDSDTAADPADDRSPYPGLAAYGLDDADHFVGREREVEALANRLVRAPLVAVLGPSGVGKSSFIHAGLVPRLREQHRILTMRPGRHPLHALAALPEVSGDVSDEAELVARLRELGDSAQRGLVLVIDQLEELVTLCADPDERRRFAATLAAAADAPSAPVRVVATLRDDFATVIEAEAALRGRFEVFVLATPAPPALRRIVIEPARRAAVAVEPSVVDEMVAEVAGRPGSLPLLSFTAAQLWQHRDRAARAMTREAYVALGGVAGALASYADQLYASLARRDQDTVRDLFARLVAADGTRIPAPRAELEQLPGARGVLAHLIDARLLVVRDEDGRDVIEIVHECLAERWPRLARWRSEDAADRALLGDLRAAARRWDEAGRRPDLLWRGQALAELRRLAAHSTALTELERRFADESGRAEQRARRFRRGLLAGAMAVLAAVAAVMAYLRVAADRSRTAAEHSASEARASADLAERRLTASLIAQGRRELNDGRALPALAYFAEALRRGADSPGLRTMIAIANRGRAAERYVVRERDVVGFALSPNGWFATAADSGRVTWRSYDGHVLGELATGFQHLDAIRRLSDDRLVVSGNDGVAIIDPHHAITTRVKTSLGPWFANPGPGPDELAVFEHTAVTVYGLDGTRRRTFRLTPSQGEADPYFDATGRYLVFAGDGAVTFLDLRTMKPRTYTHAYATPTCSADGKTCAYLDRDHVIHVTDPDGRQRRQFRADTGAQLVVLSDDGSRVGAVSEHELAMFETTGKELGLGPIDPDCSTIVVHGEDVWTAGADGAVRRYHGGTLVSSRPSHLTAIDQLQVAGGVVVSLGSDSSIVVARADEAELRLEPEPCPVRAIDSVGQGVVYVCRDGTQRVYLGDRLLATLPAGPSIDTLAYEPGSRRAAIGTDDDVGVFGPDGKQLASVASPPSRPLGAPAFIDADHLYVIEQGKALWRWTVPGNHLERLAAIPKASAVATTPRGAIVGTVDGAAVAVAGTREVARTKLGTRIDALTPSPDGRWVAAQLGNGAVAILDAATDQLVRKLEPVESSGGTPGFDATSSLVVRVTRTMPTVWDRATGDQLVYGLDLVRDAMAARFLPDGRLAVATHPPGVLDLPRDTRPAPRIIREIACRVPLEVAGSRLEPSMTACP